MGYYMRYIVADEQPVSLEDIGKAFAKAGVEYDVDGEETEVTITYQGRPIGHVALNVEGRTCVCRDWKVGTCSESL